jgi:alkylated DNA repair dioxygenase AlkB
VPRRQAVRAEPQGLVYRVDFLTPDEQRALVTRYPPGAGIGWHRDAPTFGGKVVGGEAGWAWQHSIPPVKSLRYSVTFRTVRDPARWV